MNKKKIFVVFTILLISLSSLLFSKITEIESITIHVYPGGSIQEAINDASIDDTIMIHSGIYNEEIIINKKVRVYGENRETTIINGSGIGTGILITADDVFLRYLTVKDFEEGIRIEGIGNIIEHINVENTYPVKYDTLIMDDIPIYQDSISSLEGHELHDILNGNYTFKSNFGINSPAFSFRAIADTNVQELALAIFIDHNEDDEPQIEEFTGYTRRGSDVEVVLFDPPKKDFFIKVMGYEVNGTPGLFDIEIGRYDGFGIGIFDTFGNLLIDNKVSNYPVGIWAQNTQTVNISSTEASNNLAGIVVQNDNYACAVDSNNLYANNITGIAISNLEFFEMKTNNLHGNYVSGLMAYNVSNGFIYRNEFYSNNEWGGYFLQSSNNWFFKNNCSNQLSGDGIQMMFSSDNEFEDNDLNKNSYSGIHLWLDCEYNILRENRFQNNSYNMELELSNYNTIKQNEVINGTNYGIKIVESVRNTIKNNEIKNNTKGIFFYNSINNDIILNNILTNNEQADDINSLNNWDNGWPYGGNYWSDYVGNDMYHGISQIDPGGDGIGDTSYSNLDYYPLMTKVNIEEIIYSSDLYEVIINCNLQPIHFYFNQLTKILVFNLTAAIGSKITCRITLEKTLIETLWQENYHVLVNDEQISFICFTSDDYETIFFPMNFTVSEFKIIIEANQISDTTGIFAIPSLLVLLIPLLICLFNEMRRKLKSS